MNAWENELLDQANARKDELFALLSELIRYDSQNFQTHGREMACAEFIRQQYALAGLAADLYSPDSVPGIQDHPGYLAGRGLADRPNVTGILSGTGSRQDRIMLAAHIDTMPAGDSSKWTVDPFGGLIRSNRIYGLGAGDNKSGIAAALFAARIIRENHLPLTRDIVLTAYADEEYGGGGGALAACLKYPCETYVNLDGGNFELWTASLGGGGFEARVKTGFATDTASPVIEALCQVKEELARFGARRAAELHGNPLYAGSDMERSALRILEMSCGSFGSNLDEGKIIFVFYTDKSRRQVTAELDALAKGLNAGLGEKNIRLSGFTPITRFFPYKRASDGRGAIKAMKQAAQEVCRHDVRECGACLSDLSIFLSYGSASSFSFGIMRDFSLDGGAHQPDEYVDCDQFLEYARSLLLFLVRYCGSNDQIGGKAENECR